MSIDNCLLSDRSHNSDLPNSVLRFYNWSPAAISLGYGQRQIPHHWQELAQNHGLDIVHRPSGGRAVLHKGDLTYTVVMPAIHKKRHEAYRYICEFLVQGFAELGISLSYGQAGRGYIHNPSCFSTATGADLVISDGRKLIGSAQVYRHGYVLQHGAIAIQPDQQLLEQIFGEAVPVVGLSELLQITDVEAVIAKLITALTKAAAKHFQAEFNT